MKKRSFFAIVSACSLSFFLLPSLSAQQLSSAQGANRRTAIRYLQLAKQYASEKAWKDAQTQTEIGLAYDDSIADLWYIYAVSLSMQGRSRAKVLPLVVRSLNDGEWVDYNRDGARILYADILCNTGKQAEALSVLDAEPFLYSADAEFIRAKAYYTMPDGKGGRDPLYIQKAREKIDAARRIYPLDARFARLFFQYEYAENHDLTALPPLVRKLADAFILQLSHYQEADAELELYAAVFAEGKKKTRMLNSFKARGLKAPLYAEVALKAGLISEDEALDAFTAFADAGIDRSVLESFVPLITGKESRRFLADYLTAFDGTIVSDTDGDLQPNLTVTYSRGRPLQIAYDGDQDGENDWTVECDFGVPETLHLTDGALDVLYTSWPWVQKALYQRDDDKPALEFTLVGETLAWSPFTMAVLPAVKSGLDLDFFYPAIPDAPTYLSGQTLLLASSSYELPSSERKGARIQVSLLDGVAQLARYYTADGTLYAQAQFEGGLPVMRTVDTDGDGLFETTETYARARGGEQDVLSVADEMQIMTNLFGAPASGSGFYVSMIQVDRNGDTVPDFIEEYTRGEGKNTSWDTDGDGQWDTRYVKLPRQPDGLLREEAYFHQPLTDSVVCVKSENGLPVSVSDGNALLPVREVGGVYWLGEAGTEAESEKILSALNQIADQGVSIVVPHEENRFLSVRIGKMIFGEKLPPLAAAGEESDEETDTTNAE